MGLPKVFCVFFSNDLLTSGRGENKRSEKLDKACVHFTMYITVVRVQKIYQGDTVSYIMLVICCKRTKRPERIAKLAGKCSFFLTRRKIKNNLWNQGSEVYITASFIYLPPPAKSGFFPAWILAFHLKSFIRVGWLDTNHANAKNQAY